MSGITESITTEQLERWVTHHCRCDDPAFECSPLLMQVHAQRRDLAAALLASREAEETARRNIEAIKKLFPIHDIQVERERREKAEAERDEWRAKFIEANEDTEGLEERNALRVQVVDLKKQLADQQDEQETREAYNQLFGERDDLKRRLEEFRAHVHTVYLGNGESTCAWCRKPLAATNAPLASKGGYGERCSHQSGYCRAAHGGICNEPPEGRS